MKKLLKISVLTIMTMFMVNCSSDDNGGGGAASWKLGGTTFNQGFMMKADVGVFVNYLAFDKVPTADEINNNSNSNITLNSFSVMFKNEPAAGSYDIVYHSDATQLAADEVMIAVENKTTNKRYAAFDVNAQATVTVSNGKIKVVVPEIELQEASAAQGVTETFSGTLVEQ
uniref:hypothetical protein n=1 Tax=Flavobacterium sp. TaxID=239 RepID=UPI00404ABADE